MSPPVAETVDVVVVGAGVIGLSIAWRVSERGYEVALCDPEPARGASWAAAGMLAPVTEIRYGEEPLLRSNLASARRWPSFAAALEEATGRPSGYDRSGALLVARDRDDRAALADLEAYMRELDVPVERLTSREARRIEPALAPTTRGGLFAPEDHRVDNRTLLDALAAACAEVPLLRERVTGVEVEGGRAVGVRLADGARVAAGAVVLATGAWVRDLEGLPAGTLPVRPVKGELVVLRAAPDVPLIEHIVRGLDVYLVPRPDGRVVVGATVEEQGYDTRVTAGAVLDLLRDAYDLVPGITELDLVETRAGLRPGSPDNAPLVGRGPLEGLVLAVGHFRNGLLLAPITADAVAEIVDGGEIPPEVEGFAPDRFAVEEGAA